MVVIVRERMVHVRDIQVVSIGDCQSARIVFWQRAGGRVVDV